ncbi:MULTISPECIES: gluconokinase [unclassified Maribacter]|uniref:gluconokinase n=1 Tax=unclassified Maribacter TaxID=2615042 RepID=UPI00258091F3|nr:MULTISPECIES: gluconokinase [unclassified Maribacter]|tara:strand:- start:2913 stop:3401 length:489 start_codon:yes stop_codon:yes gene_type:complete
MVKKQILYIMGVSGSGKSTIGKLLANKLQFPFFDGDDFHPEANVKKMKAGHPLNDDDRQGWLEKLNEVAIENLATGAVIVCSSLKKKYRTILSKNLEDKHKFVYLEGSFDLIDKRLSARKNHYMPAGLLQSQFDILEAPLEAITVSIDQEPNDIVNDIMRKL